MKTIKINIERQGAPVVKEEAYIVHKTKDVALVLVDFRSKWCEVMCQMGGTNEEPALSICATKRSTALDKKFHVDDDTKISFPDFKGWDMFCYDLTKYSLKITFIKFKLNELKG